MDRSGRKLVGNVGGLESGRLDKPLAEPGLPTESCDRVCREGNRRAAANSFGSMGLEYGENAALVVSLFGCGVGDECVVAELFDG